MKKLLIIGLFMFAKSGYTAWWNVCAVDTVGDVGKYCSAASEYYSGGNPTYVVYYDSTNGNLKFMEDPIYYDTVATKAIDTLGDVGKYTSMIRWKDSTRTTNVLISYYDVTNGNLKIAWRKNPLDTFIITTIDSIGNVGLFTSICFDSVYKQPRISYYDATNGDLKLAGFSDTGWVIEKIDTTGDVGQYTSIAIYKDTLCISYYDVTNGDLKLAICDGTNSTIQKIDTTGDVGKYTSIHFSSGMKAPSISYYDVTNGDLKWAYNGNIQRVDTTGDVGLYISQPNKHYFYYYYDKTNGNLKAGWTDGIIDSAGDVGQYTAEAAGEIFAFVYYYDVTNGNLKRAETWANVEENKKELTGYSFSVNHNFTGKFFSISYYLPYSSYVELKVFDVTGKKVCDLVSKSQTPGKHRLLYDTRNLLAGIYFFQLKTDNFVNSKKIVLIK